LYFSPALLFYSLIKVLLVEHATSCKLDCDFVTPANTAAAWHSADNSEVFIREVY